MLSSLALVFLVGLALASICRRIRLPRIIGMLLTGIILGPFVLNLFAESILMVSADLRRMALVIILIKAGLSLDFQDVIKVGRPALLLSFLPAVFELLAVLLLAPKFLGLSLLEAAILGTVLGAVSPAIVVPRMVTLLEKGYGTRKRIPQMILAGASLDDVFVIVLFTAFVGIAQGSTARVADFLNIPISILSGIVIGALTGKLLALFFERSYQNHQHIRNSMKVIIVLGFAFLLLAVEEWLEAAMAFSGLLAIMTMACQLQRQSISAVSRRLSEKFGKLWLAAEVILFVLVGAAVDIRYTLSGGLVAIPIMLLALLARSLGVYCSLWGTTLNRREKLFCAISYLPKATVQAAIGSVPLALGLPCGNLVLSVAVLSIIITAPLGALAMDISYNRLLERN